MPSRRSHRDRVKKQALFRDDSGNGYVVTLTCFTVSIDVGIDAKGEDLFTNATAIPCAVEHDLEECLQPILGFLHVPILFSVSFSARNKKSVGCPVPFAPPNPFTFEDIANGHTTSIVAYQALPL